MDGPFASQNPNPLRFFYAVSVALFIKKLCDLIPVTLLRPLVYLGKLSLPVFLYHFFLLQEIIFRYPHVGTMTLILVIAGIVFSLGLHFLVQGIVRICVTAIRSVSRVISTGLVTAGNAFADGIGIAAFFIFNLAHIWGFKI